MIVSAWDELFTVLLSFFSKVISQQNNHFDEHINCNSNAEKHVWSNLDNEENPR